MYVHLHAQAHISDRFKSQIGIKLANSNDFTLLIASALKSLAAVFVTRMLIESGQTEFHYGYLSLH